VLELGAVRTLDLGYYRADRVESLVVLEPDPTARAVLAERARSVPATLAIEIRDTSLADAVAGLADESYDTVVSTFTLCRVPDPEAAAAAIVRWLIPSGRLLFVEHVAAPGLRGWAQHVVAPLWSRWAGGCRLDRETLTTLRLAGLSVSDCERFPVPAGGPLLATCVQGVAWRPPVGEPDPDMSVMPATVSPPASAPTIEPGPS
jgi:SAM-dependent methyltransferase